MTEEHIEELLFEINGTLGKIETKLGSVCEVLAQHEHRITTLETNKSSSINDSWKNDLLMLLAKSMIICLTALCTIVGGSSLLSQIVSQSTYTSPSNITSQN